MRLRRSPVFRGEGVPHGDGGHVVTIPGLFAGDATLALLNDWLRRVGWVPRRSGTTFNADCWERVLERLERRVAQVAGEAGRPVALIGHSRGGLLARALAHRRPDAVDRVVTLGSALGDPHDVSAPVQAIIAGLRAYHGATTDRRARRGCLSTECACGWIRSVVDPLPDSVRVTSVYSRDDGVVHPRACRPPGATAVEVSGSHAGLAWNPRAYRAVADALAAA